MDINEARKQLKELGFRLKTESLSWGIHATVLDLDGVRMPSIFSPESLRKWKVAIDWRLELTEDVTRNGEKIYGLRP